MANEMRLTGKAAPPMANGEIVFEAPWQSRVFGMARYLCQEGQFSWDEFREKLIAVISEADASAGAADEYHYFDHFLVALTDLLNEKGMCESGEVSQRMSELAARPHGHDH